MRTTFLAALLLFAAALPAAAQDKAKPNTLTPKEIADGWILLFDGETTYGWDQPAGSSWTVKDGAGCPQRIARACSWSLLARATSL